MKVRKRGLCAKHYARWQRHGDPLTVRNFRGTTAERFEHYVMRRADGHWEWTGPLNGDRATGDYGLLFDSDKGHNVLAHRWSYEQHVGPIPDNTEIDHLCRWTVCVAPIHLEAVTHQVNILRGESPAADHARRKTCPQGHQYEIASGKRVCPKCKRDAWREWWQANRGTGVGTGGANRAKTHCPQGHPLSGENLYVPPGRPTARGCKECRRAAKRKKPHP